MSEHPAVWTDPRSGLQFWSEETGTFAVKRASGWLTDPNPTRRDRKAHELVSKDKGDDAGHLIARRFGGPDLPCNFGRQNWKQNRFGGTYFQVESMWAKELAAGNRVKVTVQEKTYLQGDGELKRTDRAFYRLVEWWVGTFPRQTHGSLEFLNSESEKMRKAMGVEVRQHNYTNNVINLADYR